MQVQSGINHLDDRPSKPLVPVTAFTFEAPRVGAFVCSPFNAEGINL